MGAERGSGSVVEHLLAKERVASSNLVFRSIREQRGESRVLPLFVWPPSQQTRGTEMSQQETAQALVQVLRDHRDDLITMLVEQAPAAGSGYEQAPLDVLRPRMASVVDACIASLARQDPELLRGFMRAAAEQR